MSLEITSNRAFTLVLILVVAPVIGCAKTLGNDDMLAAPDDLAPAADLTPLPADLERGVDLGPPLDFAGVVATRTFGEPCAGNPECVSGICLVNKCSVACDQAIANDCRQVGGFCVPVMNGPSPTACYGTLETGSDLDDAVVQPGDSIMRNVSPLGDADLFQLPLLPGTYNVTAAPGAGVDIALEGYDATAAPLGTFNTGGAGAAEEGQVTVSAAAVYFFVARDVGTTTGPYTFTVTKP
jgi:hypothetical protein